MKALVFNDSLHYDPRRAEPDPALGDSLIRVHQAGVCSTDLEITRGYMNYRGVLGHEFVGTVIESADSSLVGRRVSGEINCPCGRCDLCRGGLSNHCRDRTVLGILNHDGAFADHVRLPFTNLHPLPDGVDDDRAVFIEPLAAAFQVTRQLRVDAKTWVTVLGDGRLGLLVAQVLRNAGCPVRLIGRHADKLALCEKWQIRSRTVSDIAPRHDQDVVVDCTGSASGFELATKLVRPRGTIVLKSTVAQGIPLNLSSLVVDEVTVLGSRCGPFGEAIHALQHDAVDVLSLVSKRMKLEQGVEAMDLAGRPGVMKVILTMQ